MAVDSIIARPTNRVRVMVAEASGCCASAVSAVATDRPSPRAGAIHPMLIVMPDVTIEATAILVKLSMLCPLVLWSPVSYCFDVVLAAHQVVGAGGAFAGLGWRLLMAAAM